ncbi:MAG: YceI family protein [Opitutae bacterium]|jgi:polyisoprenoid-binding protein YceI|nr:YceI family protein [Opitutae bacterium]
MQNSILTLFLFSGLTLGAGPIKFDFKDPKNINNVIFQMDAPLESINGSGDAITGTVQFDPKDPSSTKGTILLDAASLHVGNPVLKEHIHGSDWMNVKKHPTISFKLTKLENIRKKGIDVFADAKGKMTIRNVTIEMNAPVRITYLKGLLEKRNRVAGDLLVIRSKFVVKRDDFGIRAGEKLEKVANEIEISLNVAGAAPTN